MIKAALMLLGFLSTIGPTQAAGTVFAVARYDNGTHPAVKMTTISGPVSPAGCKPVIDAFTKGLQRDCPACVKEMEMCTSNLGDYMGVWRNDRHATPYVTWRGNRYVYSGADRASLEAVCEQSAARFSGVGIQAGARCIK